MNQHPVLLDIDAANGIAFITLNRPQALNALDRHLSSALHEYISQVETNDAVRAVVIQGAGGHFMAGGDIKTFHSILQDSPDERQRFFEHFIGEVHDTITRIRCMEKPVLASVQGAVAGFGVSLMNSCDLAIAANNATFSMAYRNIGTSPDGGGTFSLPRIVGLKVAMELALLGDRFDAHRALELGLVNRVVPVAELSETSRALALRLAAGPAQALGRTKRLLNRSLSESLANQLLAEQESFAACAMGADFSTGVKAFLEKTDPQFKGS